MPVTQIISSPTTKPVAQVTSSPTMKPTSLKPTSIPTFSTVVTNLCVQQKQTNVVRRKLVRVPAFLAIAALNMVGADSSTYLLLTEELIVVHAAKMGLALMH